jgi:hypothetical protein
LRLHGRDEFSELAAHRLSYPRRRVSSTPRPLRSSLTSRSTGSSAFADDDRGAGGTTIHQFKQTIPDALAHPATLGVRDFAYDLRPLKNRGRGECRVPNAPAASRALKVVSMHASIHSGGTGIIRHSPRNGFTTYGVLSPETNSSCLRRRRMDGLTRPVGRSQDLRRLDTSNGCQDHTLLPYASAPFVLRVCRSLTSFHPPCDPVSRPTLPRPPHPIPTFVTIASRPSSRDGMARTNHIFLKNRRNLFLLRGLDRNSRLQPDGQISR